MSTLEKIINAEKEAKEKLESAAAQVSQITKKTEQEILVLETKNHEKRLNETKKLDESTRKKIEQITTVYVAKRDEIKQELVDQVSKKEKTIINKIVKGLIK